MAMQWIDNAYHFPNFKVRVHSFRWLLASSPPPGVSHEPKLQPNNNQATQYVIQTNLPVTTSMRAPGVVQAVHATEMVLAEVARELGLPQHAVQEANFYKVQHTSMNQSIGRTMS